MAYIDYESEYLFELLKVEHQDNDRRKWSGIKLEISGDHYIVPQNVETITIDMHQVIAKNVKINKNGQLAIRSSETIVSIINDLKKFGKGEQVSVLSSFNLKLL